MKAVGILATSVAAALCTAVASAAPVLLQIISPVAAGGCYGSGYCPLNFAFDDQANQSWDGTSVVSAPGDTGGTWSQYYAGRAAWIDFGANYADVKIYQTWTRYRPSSAGDMTTWAGGFFTATDPSVWPSQLATPLGNVGFTFESQTNLPESGTANWFMDSDLTSAPLTPPSRYLVLGVTAADPAGRGEEYAIVGTIGAVPEPASMALLGLGSLALLRRRRA